VALRFVRCCPFAEKDKNNSNKKNKQVDWRIKQLLDLGVNLHSIKIELLFLKQKK
jgi:hypothetical protein